MLQAVPAVGAGCYDEAYGFFSTLTMDDVEPFNTVFS